MLSLPTVVFFFALDRDVQGYHQLHMLRRLCSSQVMWWETPSEMVMLPMTGATLTPSGMVMLLGPRIAVTTLTDGKGTIKCRDIFS